MRDGKEQLAREQVHLDLAALLAAIIDHPIHSDWRRCGRAASIDRQRRFAVRIVAEFNMTDLVRHEEGLLYRGAHVFVKDQIVGGNEGRTPAVEDRRPCDRRFDVDPASLACCSKPDRSAGSMSVSCPARCGSCCSAYQRIQLFGSL
ncbi:hypothetical protein ACVWXO_000547 [Bradyrhizobium sp. LM2.7]